MNALHPTVVRFTTANTDFVHGGDTKYVRQLCEWSDLIAVQEHKFANLADNLPPDDADNQWESLQVNADRGTKGSCLAYNKKVLELRWDRLELGARPILNGHRIGMEIRWFQLAGFRHRESGRGFVGASAHEPPFRFRLLQPGYTKRLATAVDDYPNVVVGVDANMPIGRLGNQVGLRAYGKGIVGVLTDLEVLGEPIIRPWGERRGLTDHPAVTVHVFLPRSDPHH